MKNASYVGTAFIVIPIVLFSWYGCKSDSTTESEELHGLAEFISYSDWEIIDRTVGPDPLLSVAHGTTDDFVRVVYIDPPEAQPVGGSYPVGTIIVKELRDQEGETVGPLTALIKRGGNFNPAGNGWEWFMTNEERTAIMTSGDNETAMDGMCAGCHSAATNPANGIDWVFHHPYESEISLSDFVDFENWENIDENFGPDPFLMQAHGIADSLYRLVYVNYRVAPVRSVYPTRTIIVKELRDKDGESTGPLTVMAKRGGNFNPAGNGWEWFMTNPERNAIMTRGDNATAMDGMCASCHSAATNPPTGVDWVFSHPRN
jgi:cytochrome c553